MWSKKFVCCNPFGKDRHNSERKNLRPVQEYMRIKFPGKFSSAYDRICDGCRKKVGLPVSSLPDQNFEEGSEVDHQTSEGNEVDQQTSEGNGPVPSCSASSEQDIVDMETAFALDSFNSSIRYMIESPLVKQKLAQQKYPKRKLEEITSALKKRVLHIESDDDSDDDEINNIMNDFGSEILSQLKEKFHQSTRSEKIQILTLLPKNWSIRQTTADFGAPEFMVRKAKKLAKKGSCLLQILDREEFWILKRHKLSWNSTTATKSADKCLVKMTPFLKTKYWFHEDWSFPT